jgi:hypothetical protein
MSASINALAAIINTKYSDPPQNTDLPLWRAASRATNSLVAATVRHIKQSTPNNIPPAQLRDFFSATTVAATAMLTATGLDTLTTPPTPDKILNDETFDIETFRSLHNSIIPTLGMPVVSNEIRKTYIITLFRTSLVAKPWFFDFPDDLVDNPLEAFSTVRMGTVCAPVFSPRQKICYTALDALFGLVSQQPQPLPDQQGPHEASDLAQHRTLARAAAPYLLLRIVHAFKTFMADQPLRSLTPLPRPLRVELLTLLSQCLELRSEEGAFAALAKGVHNVGGGSTGDGKAHLRILYPMLLRLREKWAWCPRLNGGGAWQEGQEGREIEEKLKEWGMVVAGDWGMVE